MIERTVVARRIICDSVVSILHSQGVDDSKAVHKIKIDKEMLRYCCLARIWYRNFLDEQKDQAKVDSVNQKKKQIYKARREKNKKS